MKVLLVRDTKKKELPFYFTYKQTTVTKKSSEI